MIGNLSTELPDYSLDYPTLDNQLAFGDYISRCQAMIQTRRPDLNGTKKPCGNATTKQILLANSPFELTPKSSVHSQQPHRYGALLIHGLFDSPFSLRDLGHQLEKHGVLSRAVLLPGHGTLPQDLLKVHYQDWIKVVKYGIESLSKEVDEIFLIGYSTGAALAVHEAIQNTDIKGIVLLAPAIKIKAPVDIVVAWQYFLKHFRNHKDWLALEDEINYAKYLSIPFNAVYQVSNLTDVIDELNSKTPVKCPVFMSVSREDETISSHTAIDFFTALPHEESRLLLYTSYDHPYPDKRIITRETHYPTLNIKHFSHMSLPFMPNNTHYGQQGDYAGASHIGNQKYLYGAYNRIEVSIFDLLENVGLAKFKRHELTYNPDFDFLSKQILDFIIKE